MSFKVFNRIVTRQTANNLIVQDMINSCVNGGDEEFIFTTLMAGWVGVSEWDSEGVQQTLDTLIESNFTEEQLKVAGLWIKKSTTD